MRINLVRSIVVVIGAVTILLVAPSLCAASPDMGGGMRDSVSSQEVVTVQQGFAASDSMPSHHLLMKVFAEQFGPPNRLVVSEHISFSWFPVNLPVEPVPLSTQQRPLERDIMYLIIYFILLSTSVEYHYRNYPKTEEPPL